MTSNTDEDRFIQNKIPEGAYEFESLNNEFKRIIKDEGLFSRANYPFIIKPNYSTLGSIIQISPHGPIISFMFDDSIRDLLGFHAFTLSEEYNLSPNLVDILSFDNNLLKCDIAQGKTFKSRRSRVIHNFTMDVDPG